MIAKIESGTWKVSATELVRSSRGLIDPSIDSSLSHRRAVIILNVGATRS